MSISCVMLVHNVGSRAARFKRPLSVDVSVCVSATLTIGLSRKKTKRFRNSCQIRTL